MDTVLVTGGTGHLGKDLLPRLKGSHRVRVLSRSPGSDPDVQWIRGDLDRRRYHRAVAGSQTVIHAATLSPAARRGYFVPKDLWSSPAEVDRDGTARLLEQAAAAGVGHLIYVSIVGIDKPRVPYLRRKLEAEYLVLVKVRFRGRSPSDPVSWLLDRMLSARWHVARWCRCRTEGRAGGYWRLAVIRRIRRHPRLGRLADFGGPKYSPSPRPSTGGDKFGSVPFARCAFRCRRLSAMLPRRCRSATRTASEERSPGSTGWVLTGRVDQLRESPRAARFRAEPSVACHVVNAKRTRGRVSGWCFQLAAAQFVMSSRQLGHECGDATVAKDVRNDCDQNADGNRLLRSSSAMFMVAGGELRLDVSPGTGS